MVQAAEPNLEPETGPPCCSFSYPPASEELCWSEEGKCVSEGGKSLYAALPPIQLSAGLRAAEKTCGSEMPENVPSRKQRFEKRKLKLYERHDEKNQPSSRTKALCNSPIIHPLTCQCGRAAMQDTNQAADVVT